jgi:hypothetical protein
MKNNRQIKYYLGFLLLILAYYVQGQTDFRPGFVIDSKNDTLLGEINYRGDEFLGKKCVFKSKSTGNITEYKPEDITAFRFNDDRFFVSKEIKDLKETKDSKEPKYKKMFLEFLIKGKVNIYYLRDDLIDYYFIDREGNKIEELSFKEELVYGSGNGVYLSTSNTHKAILKKFMKDAPEFQSRINQITKPEHGQLIKLAKDYHNQVCKDESCIIYKRKTPVGVSLEAVVGGLKYGNSEKIEQNIYANFGILAHVWLPRVNEKLYFRTGIIYSRIGLLSEASPFGSTLYNNVNIYKIPVQLEYIYPKGRVRPIFAYGLNFYKPFSFTVGFMGGINIKFTEKIALGLNYDIDFIPFSLPILPARFFSQSVLIGLKVKL